MPHETIEQCKNKHFCGCFKSGPTPNTFSFVNLSNISDSVVIRDSIQYRSFEVTSLKVLDAGVGA